MVFPGITKARALSARAGGSQARGGNYATRAGKRRSIERKASTISPAMAM